MPRLLIVFLFVATLRASASGQGLGVGIIAGNPTGVSVKKWLPDGHAIDGAAAWSFNDYGAFQLHADYLWHHHCPAFSECTHGWMPLYYGLGGRVGFYEGNRWHGGHTRAGVRVPFGVTYVFEEAPLDVFVEIVPILDVAPSTAFRLNAAAGARFYIR
jgi:hypothetical protein